MVYYEEQHKFFDNRLNIVKKITSKYWIGRTYIDGKSTEKSSKTLNFAKAKTILFKWYRSLEYKLENDIVIHDLQFNKLFKQYLNQRFEYKDTAYTKDIAVTYNAFFKVFFANRKINSIAKKTILEYIKWRIAKFKKDRGRSIARFTLEGDIAKLGGFLTWCYENEHREKNLRLSKRWISEIKSNVKNEGTGRTFFTIQEYNKLLKNSRRRVKESIDKWNNPRYYFDREYLHQFIIFSTHAGTRVGETLNLKWKDVKFNHHKQRNKCSLDLNVSGKTGTRKALTYFGSYYALEKVKELFKKYDRPIKPNDKVFQVNFKKGLNYLLNDCNLKTTEQGGKSLRRDAKSLRSTYISWGLIRGQPHEVIARNCGTGIGVIQKFYSKHIEIEKYRKQLTEIDNYKNLYQ
jgi:integrase